MVNSVIRETKCHYIYGSKQAIKFKQVPMSSDVWCSFFSFLTKFLIAHQMVWVWFVRALYVNNSINEFMYGFLDVEEGYCFENKCTVKYGKWDTYAIYPEWKSQDSQEV